MSCQRCGRQANGRLCRDCERDEKFGNAGADQSQPDRGDLRHECTECNTEYETDGSDDCPNCGSSRRRFVGDETEQAAGHREVYCPTHPDARIKARTRNDMVGCPVTTFRCFICNSELTPQADGPAERVATDGGVEQSTSGIERKNFVATDSVERTQEYIDQIKPGETMLEYQITGGGIGTGKIDTVRKFESHKGELQVRPWFGGKPIWVSEESAAEELVGRPIRIVEYCSVSSDTDDVATDGGVDVDGGRQAFLAGDAHYCDICERQFQTLVELIKHDCEQTGSGTTIRGPDPATYAEWEESR